MDATTVACPYPPALLEVDQLLLCLHHQDKPVLSFQFTLDQLPWQVVLERPAPEVTTLSLMIELAALPFTAENSNRRMAALTLMHALNAHWQRQGQDMQMGLSPRRNTVFLLIKIALDTSPEMPDLLRLVTEQVLMVRPGLSVLEFCTPWLLQTHKKTSSLSGVKR
jgi:hypothetical protein